MAVASEVDRFEAIYRAEVRGVWRFLQRLGIRPPATDDLTHQVFLVAFGRWRSLDQSKPPGPWLRGIAWKVAADHRRLHLHGDAPLDDVSPASAIATEAPADERLAARRALQALEAALAELNADQRAVFVMHELESMGIGDIAEAMGTPVPTVHSRLRLARARLSERLAEHRDGGAR